jgi:hypothetical protein
VWDRTRRLCQAAHMHGQFQPVPRAGTRNAALPRSMSFSYDSAL